MTIFFPDVSGYQAGLSLAGAVAVIVKADEGSDWHDPSYGGFHQQAVAMGIPFAAYHFTDAIDVAAQAADTYAVVGPNVPVMWDAEAAGADVPHLVELTTQLRALGGNPTLVYLPHWWWQQIGSPDLTPLVRAGLALIASNYTTYSDTGPGWQPYGGVTPAIWQYTSTQTFNGQHVDFNAFKGTVAQLRDLFNGGTVTSPTPTELETLSILQAMGAGAPSATMHGEPWNVDLTGMYRENGKAALAVIQPNLDALAATLSGLATAVTAIANELDTIKAAIAALPAAAAAPTAQEIAKEELDEEAARLAQ